MGEWRGRGMGCGFTRGRTYGGGIARLNPLPGGEEGAPARNVVPASSAGQALSEAGGSRPFFPQPHPLSSTPVVDLGPERVIRRVFWVGSGLSSHSVVPVTHSGGNSRSNKRAASVTARTSCVEIMRVGCVETWSNTPRAYSTDTPQLTSFSTSS